MDPDTNSLAPSATVRLRERLEGEITTLAAAMLKRNEAALADQAELLRSEAEKTLLAQCRQLVALSRTIAGAEAEREQRFAALERELREAMEARIAAVTPRPLDIPRPRVRDGEPRADLWSSLRRD